MSIPNISTLYQKINKGAEGGHEFARFIKLLLLADFASKGEHFISESDASGDYKKLDGYVPDKNIDQLIKGFQFKFYPSKLTNQQKNEIIQSIEKAIHENKYIDEFILITPEDWQKEQSQWFEKLKQKYEHKFTLETGGSTYFLYFSLVHWGHSKIIELALKYDHIGVQYFPELYPIGVGKFKLSKATVDPELCSWNLSKHTANQFYQSPIDKKNTIKTSDPVFDFHFKNSTNDIHLLNKVEIHIEKVWSTLKGIPKDQYLRSVGTIEHEIDFTKAINDIILTDPLIFEAHTPKRFKLRLNNFEQKCPENWVQIKFWFYFDEITIPTDSFVFCL